MRTPQSAPDHELDLRLYAIVDPERAGGREPSDLASLVAGGGATLVQLRDKYRDTRPMVEAAHAIKAKLEPVLGVAEFDCRRGQPKLLCGSRKISKERLKSGAPLRKRPVD